MKLPFPKRASIQPVMGLDLGSSGFRAAWILDEGQELTLVSAGYWQQTFAPSDGLTASDYLDHLAELVRQSASRSRKAVTAVSALSMELHPLEIPYKDKTPEQELQKAVDWELTRLSTIPQEALRTAVWKLPRSRRSKWTLMGVAAHSQAIEDRISMCERSGLDCVKVDAAACALASLIWRLRGKPVDQVWGIYDVGHTQTRLLICYNDSPIMTRAFGAGGQDWTQKIAAALQIGPELAQQYQRDYGIAYCPHAADENTRSEEGDHVEERYSRQELSTLIFGALRDDLQRMCIEAERAYEYVLQCYGTRSAGDLVLVGGGALLRGLGLFFSRSLGIQVYPVSQCHSPVAQKLQLELGMSRPLEMHALACGLSLQGVEDAHD